MSKRQDRTIAVLRDMVQEGVLPDHVFAVAVRYVDDRDVQEGVLDPTSRPGLLLSRLVQLVEVDRVAAVADRSSWKEAWWVQRDATGLNYWDGYRDARQDVLDGHPDRYVSGPRPRPRD